MNDATPLRPRLIKGKGSSGSAVPLTETVAHQRDPLRAMSPGRTSFTEVFTDGACEPNPGPDAYAAIIVDERSEHEWVGYEKRTTNNLMELMAAMSATQLTEVPEGATPCGRQ